MAINRNLSILAQGASASGVLAVANGGSGVTTSTGTGNNVLSASPTFTGTVGCAAISPTGLVDISAAGAGQIKFPATQNASADANTLDDYEEGTWTPGVSFGGASVGLTLSGSGTYTRIGRQVTCWVYFALTNKGSSTGNAKVTGLPFTISTANATYGIVGAAETANITVTAGLQLSNFGTGSSVTTMDITTGNVNGTAAFVTNTNFSNATNITSTFSYNA